MVKVASEGVSKRVGNCDPLYWGKKFTCDERSKIVEISKRLMCNPNFLTSAIALETGGTFNPSIVNSLGYTGLIQIGTLAASDINGRKKTNITAGKGGTLSKMSILEQLTYVEYYLEPFKGKLNTLADFYLAILMPVDCGKGNQPNHIVFDREIELDYNSSGDVIKNTKWIRQRAYKQNPAFFKEGKNENGKTYVWEVDDEIQKWYKKGEKEQHECLKNCPAFKEDKPKKANSLWHDPIDNPEITLHNYYGDFNPKGSSFGMVRNGGKKPHQGLDIFAPKGTPVKACLTGVVVTVNEDAGAFGKFVVIEISKSDLDKSKNEYTIKYDGEIENGSSFGDSDKRYLRYGHLSKIDVILKQGVTAGDVIGESGNTGNAKDQNVKARHLHFEITDAITAGKGLINRTNPSFYVNLISPNKETQSKNNK